MIPIPKVNSMDELQYVQDTLYLNYKSTIIDHIGIPIIL